MKRLIILLGMTVFVYIAASSFMGDTAVESAPPDRGGTKYQIINIITKHLDSSLKKPFITPRCAELNFSNKEEVVWVTVPPGQEFEVVFKNRRSPFSKSEFSEEDPVSGPPVNYSNPKSGDDEYFPYTVKIDGDEVDPGVLIWN